MAKKVLMLLSNPFRPDPRVQREALSLIRNGYEVTIICWDRDRKHPESETVDGIRIIRVGPAAGWGEAGRFMKALPKFWRNLRKTAAGLEFDIIHAHDLDTLAPGLRIAGKRKVPLIYDSHEIYHEMASENLSGFLLSYLTGYEARMVRKPKVMVTVNEPIADVFRKMGAKDVRVVMNCQPEAKYDPALAKEARPRMSPSGKPVLLYIGVLEPNRLILELAEAHSAGNGDFALALGGYGTLEEKVKSIAESSGGRVMFLGRISPADVPAYNSAADMLLATYDPARRNNRLGAPNKLFEAMIASKPILVSKGTFAAEVVAKTGCGRAVDYSAESVLGAADEIFADPATMRKCGMAGRKAFEERYNWPAMEKVMLKAYSDLLTE